MRSKSNPNKLISIKIRDIPFTLRQYVSLFPLRRKHESEQEQRRKQPKQYLWDYNE